MKILEQTLVARAAELGFRVERSRVPDLYGHRIGCCLPEEGRIWVSGYLRAPSSVLVLAHEVGHAEQWDRGRGQERFVRLRGQPPRAYVRFERGAWQRAGRILSELGFGDLPWRAEMEKRLATYRE